MFGRRVIAVLLLLVSASPAGAALGIPPAPSRRINDYAGILSPGDRDRLERRLAERERRSENQVVVAIFQTLGGESLEDYSIRLAQAWRIGRKGLDSGVILLVFVRDRKMRLEVGYGLEATLTDAVSASILREVVAPRFREGRMAEGIADALEAIDRAIAGSYRGPASRHPSGGMPSLLVLALVAGVAMAGLSGAAMGVNAIGRRRRGWTGGRRGWGPPAAGPGRREGGVVWPWLGSGLGGSGDVGGGGGFSGGGGSFGGGGASGSW